MEEKIKSYWEKRAKTYGLLDDVKSKRTAYKIVNQIKKFGLNKEDFILDVGCGEGLITRVIRDNIRDSIVLGVDISERMIKKAKKLERKFLKFYVSDFFDMSFDKACDLITMNLVLHHLIRGDDKRALSHAYSFIREEGWILISEAVPPEDNIYDYYKDIFSFKEERNCYLVSDLRNLLRIAGFHSVESFTFRFNIRLSSWLNDETLSERRRNILYDMHVNGSNRFKKAYKMESIGNGDYILSCKMAVVFGRK